MLDRTMAMRGGRYVFLIKAATSETWWRKTLTTSCLSAVVLVSISQCGFVPADNKRNPLVLFFAGAIAVFDKITARRHFNYIGRTELEGKRKAFMSLVEFAAGKVQPPATTVPEQEEEPIVAPAVLPDIGFKSILAA